MFILTKSKQIIFLLNSLIFSRILYVSFTIISLLFVSRFFKLTCIYVPNTGHVFFFFFNDPGLNLRTFQNDVITIRYAQFTRILQYIIWLWPFFGDSIYLLRNQTPPIVRRIVIYCIIYFSHIYIIQRFTCTPEKYKFHWNILCWLYGQSVAKLYRRYQQLITQQLC